MNHVLHCVPDGACTQPVGYIMRLVDVRSEHSCCQTVFGVVGSFHHLLQRLELHDLHHWTKNLQQKMEEIHSDLRPTTPRPHVPPTPSGLKSW